MQGVPEKDRTKFGTVRRKMKIFASKCSAEITA